MRHATSRHFLSTVRRAPEECRQVAGRLPAGGGRCVEGARRIMTKSNIGITDYDEMLAINAIKRDEGR